MEAMRSVPLRSQGALILRSILPTIRDLLLLRPLEARDLSKNILDFSYLLLELLISRYLNFPRETGNFDQFPAGKMRETGNFREIKKVLYILVIKKISSSLLNFKVHIHLKISLRQLKIINRFITKMAKSPAQLNTLSLSTDVGGAIFCKPKYVEFF